MKAASDHHRERAEAAEAAVFRSKRVLRWTVLGRLLAFLFLIGSVWATWQLHPLVPVFAAFFFLSLFLILVRYHARKEEEKEESEEKAALHRRDLARVEGELPEGKPVDAPEPEHPFAHDLDLFAEQGLFAWVDRSFSAVGRRRLAERLARPSEDPSTIRKLQEAVSELSEQRDERMEWRVKGRKLEGLDSGLVRDAEKPGPRALPAFLRYLIPALMTGLFIVMLIGFIPFRAFLFALALPLGVLALRSSLVRETFRRMEAGRKAVKGIGKVLERIEGMRFEGTLLKEQQERLRSDEGKKAGEAIAALDRILEAYEARSNPFVGVLLNLLFLWDLQCHERLRRWIRSYGEKMEEWVELVGEFDSLASLAALPSDHSELVFPELRDEGKVLEGKALGHPLIPAGERVDNDLEIPDTGHIKIVTGANMAGKSTFLRTIGVNWILAKAGTAVCAEYMAFRPLHLFSSMRTSDSLLDHESFFYAELKRLRAIVDELERGKELLILLDEILQGTNSEDKKQGSRRFLERVLRYPVAGLIATHDLDLTKMEESMPGKVENLCFEAELEDGRSSFDYLLRKGVCRNMNASALMERMGIG